MLVDAWRTTPAFCSFRAGCDEVTNSRYGRALGLPLSLWGLIAFGSFYTLTLLPTPRVRRLLGPLAILAGLIGVALVAVQFYLLKRSCPFCLLVDAAAILLATVELAVSPTDDAAPAATGRRWLWGSAALIAVTSPLVWSLFKPSPPVPAEVQAHWVEARINIVELTDFACPFCRESHVAME